MGTSLKIENRGIITQDHPHACGDKKKAKALNCHGRGSSPRVWGQVKPLYLQGLGVRIIPTRVGTRCYHKIILNKLQDHPHACGDKYPSAAMSGRKRGIIPTRVGTRVLVYICIKNAEDHPHACGDKIKL